MTCLAADEAGRVPPRLAVVIAVDQCRADYLNRFRPYFVEGGFRRFLEAGAVYSECYYRHATTKTAVGHATFMTGVHANVHGIIGNEWLDRDSLKQISAVDDPSKPLVGVVRSPVKLPGSAGGDLEGASPRWLEANTVGDELKRRWGTAHVISMSIKDKPAVLMGGHSADAAYWLVRGRFVTSRFYRDSLPEWVEEFNAERRVEKDFGREWTRLLDPKIYDSVQGRDDQLGKQAKLGLGTVFPRRVDGGEPKVGGKFYDAYDIAPFCNELLGQFAQTAISAEKLGRHDAPDLLCVSFSQPDYCGHEYGPDSHEIMDSVLRLDRVLADLFAFLDREVGAGRYTVVLTADHGVAPLPEHVQAAKPGTYAARFDPAVVVRAVESALTAELGPPPEGMFWAVRDNAGFHFRAATLQAKQATRSRAAAIAKAALLKLPQVAVAFTRDELTAEPPRGDSTIAMVRRSFNAERSQDIIFVLKPYVVDRLPGGTNHGTPYDYDTHVPMLWYGAGVPRGTRSERVSPDQLAPTLAAILKIPGPKQCEATKLF